MTTNNHSDEMAAGDVFCASCGVGGIDEVKLKECPDCDLVRYCSDECQQNHLETHEATCKERAAELRDDILFRQPESSHLGDCPICFLPMPLDANLIWVKTCCSKRICAGCIYAEKIHDLKALLRAMCPFCRQSEPSTDDEINTNLIKRASANDQVALQVMGCRHYDKEEYDTAIKYFTRAAELGNAMAHFKLAALYYNGKGVEQDKKKEIYHLEEAAIAGHPEARYDLGLNEAINERYGRAVKHWIIAANFGHDDSIQILKEYYKDGHVSKDDLAAALRAHQAAVDEMMSPQREAGEKC